MEIVSTSEDLVIDNSFDARKYLDTYFSKDPKCQKIDEDVKYALKFLVNVFSSGRVKGKSLIEIGSGPTIHNIIPACEIFEEIYLTDYTQGSLLQIEKWLKDSNDAFDWSPFLRYVCDIENNRSTPEEKANLIRRKVSLMKCDVSQTNPLQPNSLPLTNCVITSSCLICVAKNFKEYKTVVKNVVSLIKPGGYLIIFDYFGASYYMVGKTKLPVLTIDEKNVKEAVAESGCEIEDFKMFTDFRIQEEVFDCKKTFCLLARKL
ncbi:nicotinamide N-methyltransferase-like [Mixophyes fleayi]|uniref:nicotinamide N-methyltransferase-like n=1 Tax=Mixophyes fleayi TaxID=3061075 RepID=UPI003F4DF6E7